MIVYLLRNTATGKCYVGKTSATLKARWRQHKTEARICRHDWPLYRDMRRYGFDAFELSEIGQAESRRRLRAMELDAIIKHNGFPGGYNQSPSSTGGKRKRYYRSATASPLTPEHKRKIAESVRLSWALRKAA